MMTRHPLTPSEAQDLLVSDFVHAPNGTGWIESINGDHATVAYDCGRKDILPLVSLVKCKHGGGGFDRRHG